MNESESKFAGWHPKAKDIPGQVDIFGAYAAKPDEACRKCAKPLEPPIRASTGPLPEVHMVIAKDGAVWWEDDKGNCVSTDNRHPYTRKKY